MSVLLTGLASRFPNRRAFATAIGVDPSRLSRAMSGDSTMFDALRCCYVARATHTDPVVVLRAAEKGQLADVLQELFGAALTEKEHRVLTAFRRLTPEAAQALMAFFEDVLAIGTVEQPPARDRRRGGRRDVVAAQRLG